MSNLKPVPIREAWIADSNELLQDALDAEFDSVIILGYKDGNLHCKQSATIDFVKMIGALEWAKYRLMEGLDSTDDD